MRRVLIAGAGGGIGSALVDTLATRADVGQIYALHRREVCSTARNVTWLTADLTDPLSVGDAVGKIRGTGLDLVIVASGLLHDTGLAPEKSLAAVDPYRLQTAYLVNAAAPLALLAAVKPLLAGAADPLVCFLSAQVGSIGDNRLGGWYGYRMAKAALNMGVRTAAVELAREPNTPTVVAVHPGTTRTSLSEPFIRRRRQPVAAPHAAALRLIELLENLSPEQTGAFLNYDGVPLPW